MSLPKPSWGKVIGFVAVMIVIVVAWYWYAAAARSTQGDSLRSVRVTRGTIEEAVTAQGKLEPKRYVDVGTQVSGQLKKIHVDIGDLVRAGQLLAEIDPRVHQAQVEANEARIQSLKAQLAQQRAELNLAEENLKRNRSLIAMDAISRQALEESESQAAVAQAKLQAIAAQIRETESNLQGSRTNLGFTRIYAPIGGTVTTMSAREGQTLNANQSAPIILQVADLDTMTVRAQAAEADISRLREGMDVYFTTLGNNERRWQSTVNRDVWIRGTIGIGGANNTNTFAILVDGVEVFTRTVTPAEPKELTYAIRIPLRKDATVDFVIRHVPGQLNSSADKQVFTARITDT